MIKKMIHDLAQLLSAMGFDESLINFQYVLTCLPKTLYIWCGSLGTKYKETKNQTF